MAKTSGNTDPKWIYHQTKRPSKHPFQIIGQFYGDTWTLNEEMPHQEVTSNVKLSPAMPNIYLSNWVPSATYLH